MNTTHPPSQLAELNWRKNATEVETSHATDESFAAATADVRQQMADALSKVIEESKLAISPDAYGQWRATRRTRGMVRGVVEGVTCIATDGVLAIFVFDDGAAHPTLGTAFKGHVAYFEWDEETTRRVAVKDDETKEEKVVTVRQHKGPPPPLFSTATKGKTTNSVAIRGGKRTSSVAAREKRLALLDELGL